MKIINPKNYRSAVMLHKSGHDVLANLFLRAAYGVKQ
ncbi:hypothetical protein QE407_003095 [Pantoea dispersa]|nr:hypothetical protein [Pantoea dispersa]